MKIDSDNIGPLFLGTEEIGKAYLGTGLVHEEMKFVVVHPDYWYFEITTTSNDYWINMFYATQVQTYILDDVDVTSSCTSYGTVFGTEFGQIKIPTAGRHTIWVSPSQWSAGSTDILGPIGADVLYVGNHLSSSFDAPNSLTTLYITSTTPPEQPSTSNFASLEHIYVPKHLVNTYKAAWSAWSNIIEGITFDSTIKEMSLRMSKSFIADNPTILYGGYERWTYRGGLLLRGVLGVYDAYSNDKDVSDLLAYAKKYYHDCVNSGGIVGGAWGSYAKSNYDSDQVQAAFNLFRLKQLDSDTTYQGYYENVIGILIDQLADQPRLAEPTSVSGTAGHPFQHKANYAYQHWLDGDFMVEPFRALYAHDRLSGQSQADMYDDIVEQLINTAALTYDTDTQLYRHAFAGQGSSASWSENGANTVGRSYFSWGRALGWYILGICEVLDIIPSTHNPTRRADLINILSGLLTRLLTYRDTSGVWALLPTLAVDTTNNKLEATSSCMYAYGYLHGVRMGYLSADMRDTALSIYQAVVRNFVVSVGASVTLKNCVTGGNPGASSTTQTDVLNNYYSKPFADNDEHGVGPFIMASLEYELITTT
jgi:unsaturated rhamnogalacturonyl hydrolase